MEIEVQGALQIMNKMKGCITIFILPPSFEILEQRLRGRGTEEEAVIQQRLLKAKEEIQYADLYQYRIINYDIEESYKELRTIYLRHSSQQ